MHASQHGTWEVDHTTHIQKESAHLLKHVQSRGGCLPIHQALIKTVCSLVQQFPCATMHIRSRAVSRFPPRTIEEPVTEQRCRGEFQSGPVTHSLASSLATKKKQEDPQQ